MTPSQIAKAAGISPATRHFVLRDEYGLPYDGSRSAHVLAALQRDDLAPGLDDAARIAARGLYKSYSTGRMNVHLALRIREQLTPYQLCALVAHVAATAGVDADDVWPCGVTVGYLADYWINKHADELAVDGAP